MTNICEEEQILGQEQFGFRRKRSTIDAVFVLSTLIKKAKLKRWQFATAFLDISKVFINNSMKPVTLNWFQAYDSVWRPGLFAKLSALGFGGRTLSLIKSMYTNDSVSFLINGHFTSELWLTRGVKQGKRIQNLIMKTTNVSVQKAAIFLHCCLHSSSTTWEQNWTPLA